MLNIASSYTELKDKKNAKKALQQLVAKYPDSTGRSGRERPPGRAEVSRLQKNMGVGI